MKMNPEETGQEFLTRVQNLAASLQAIGSKVEEALVVSTALCGMGEVSTYNLFVASYNMKSDDQQDLSDLRAMLMKYENTVKNEAVDSSFKVSAQKRQGNAKKQGTSTVKCFRCAKIGHMAAECDKKNATCNFCRKKGHLEAAC